MVAMILIVEKEREGEREGKGGIERRGEGMGGGKDGELPGVTTTIAVTTLFSEFAGNVILTMPGLTGAFRVIDMMLGLDKPLSKLDKGPGTPI